MKKFIHTIVMFIYAVMLLVLMITKNIRNYIHPRLYPFLILSVLLLLIMFIYSIYYIKISGRCPFLKNGIVVFFIPIFLMIIPTDINVSADVAAENGIKIYDNTYDIPYDKNDSLTKKLDEDTSAQGIEYNNDISVDDVKENLENKVQKTSEQITEDEILVENETLIQNSEENINKNDESFDQSEDENASIESDMPVDTLETELASGDMLFESQNWNPKIINGEYIITTEDFTVAMQEIQVDLDKYVGSNISYMGMVYRQDDFDSNEIVIGRMLMYCCAADAQIVGLLSYSDNVNNYKDGDWVEIRGVLETKDYKDPASDYVFKIPYLRITNFKIVQKPKDPYVYF